MSVAYEVNFDGIVGPTHNYAGLSFGNVASMTNKASVSSPKQAALQGLAKMKFMADLGLKQAVLPPHERPYLPTLRSRGYEGTDTQILEKIAKDDPSLLARVSSASAMWAANAATVSPSADTADRRVQFTPANLVSNLHRAIETATTSRVLRAIFSDRRHFAHLQPLPPQMPDEGAANHMRLCLDYGSRGVEVFVCGPDRATRYPARQAGAASMMMIQSHLLVGPTHIIRQSSAAIDAGAFHNDVVAVADRHVLLVHEDAWEDLPAAVSMLRESLPGLKPIVVKREELPLGDAIKSYLFNSQLVTLPDGTTSLVAPVEAAETESVRRFVEQLVAAADPIRSVHFIDVRQSMRNGGGPACLRLRVVLTETELAATHRSVIFNNELHEQLRDWIDRRYRDSLAPADLADPKLLEESRSALDELTRILELGSIYEFQR